MPSETSAGRTMQIGELAERTGLSLRTIRHYDDVGLLRPSARSAGGFRLYTGADLERLMLIRRMKPLGFSLEEMSEVLRIVDGLANGAGADRAQLRSSLDEFITAAQERRAAMVQRLAMADEFIGLLKAHT